MKDCRGGTDPNSGPWHHKSISSQFYQTLVLIEFQHVKILLGLVETFELGFAVSQGLGEGALRRAIDGGAGPPRLKPVDCSGLSNRLKILMVGGHCFNFVEQMCRGDGPGGG